MGDFRVSESLSVGEIRSIQWDDTGENVTKNGHLIGLNSRLRESLLEYCEDMGITQRMKEMTFGSQHLPQADFPKDIDIQLKGFDWFIQRVSGMKWRSDMHWMSPSDAQAQENYLEAFGRAGFDEVLQSIGEHFGYKGLVAYHLSIIAVSRCTPGRMHVDATGTGSRSMNVIIPLILAKDAGPELNVQGDDEFRKMGEYKYQYEVAALVGDDCFHGTNAVDYNGEMRMAATIYVADVDEGNIAALTNKYVTYPKHYPPVSQPEILLKQARKHWDRENPSKMLPTGRCKDKTEEKHF